ncbi:MAG: hypothetical protein Q8Q49_01935 [bacterium]|nr:hypothetical protein [bacterium]
MRVKKRILVLASIFIVLLAISFVFYFFNSSKPRISTCVNLLQNPWSKKCSSITLSDDKKSAILVGVVSSKDIKEGMFYVNLTTSDSNGKEIIKKLLLPSNSNKIALTELGKDEARPYVFVHKRTDLHSSKYVYDMIVPGEAIEFAFPTYISSKDYKDTYLNNLVRCAQIARSIADYLSFSTILNWVRSSWFEYSTGCLIMPSQVFVIR